MALAFTIPLPVKSPSPRRSAHCNSQRRWMQPQKIRLRTVHFSTFRTATLQCNITPVEVVSQWDDAAFILSSDEAREILTHLECRKSNGETVVRECPPCDSPGTLETDECWTTVNDISIELGRKQISIQVDSERRIARVLGVDLTKSKLENLSSRNNAAWAVFDDCTYSRIAGHGLFAAVSLHPVRSSMPTVVVGGFGMHRFARDVKPCADTRNKIEAAQPNGRVLDICTGLGYTAIAAARLPGVSSVLTLEVDEVVLSITKANPWSQDLFADPKITIALGDATELVSKMNSASFDTICHDPPALAFGGDLYSASFYAQLRRVLTPHGRLFHYIGSPQSKESGRLFSGVRKRLKEVGFADVSDANEAYGVVARVDPPVSVRRQFSAKRRKRK